MNNIKPKGALKREEKLPTCADCSYSCAVKDGKENLMMECRYNPPVLQVVVIPTQLIGSAPQIMKQSGFPNCLDICSKFEEVPGRGH